MAKMNNGDRLVATLKRKLLFETVSEELADLILTGELEPGARLPSEHDLAAQFGVSRNVVREGLRGLIEQGLVVVRPGNGIYAQSPDQNTVVDAFSRYMQLNRSQNWLEELYEVRRHLESGIAGLAAERATPDDLEALETAFDEMRAHTDDSHAWARADWGFHKALARASHNTLFPMLLNPLYEQILVAFEEAWRYPRAYESGLRYHAKIIEHVRARDPKAARAAMLAHLEQSYAEASEVLQQRSSQQVVESVA